MANITLNDVHSRPYSDKGRDNFDKIFPKSIKDFEKKKENINADSND